MSCRVAFQCVFLLLLSGGLVAQSPRSTVQGVVTLEDGSAVPGTTITMRSPSFPQDRVLVSNAEGRYLARGVPPGDYVLTFELEGFSTVKSSVKVEGGETATRDARLQISEVVEQIVVSDGASPPGAGVASGTFTGAVYSAEKEDERSLQLGLDGGGVVFDRVDFTLPKKALEAAAVGYISAPWVYDGSGGLTGPPVDRLFVRLDFYDQVKLPKKTNVEWGHDGRTLYKQSLVIEPYVRLDPKAVDEAFNMPPVVALGDPFLFTVKEDYGGRHALPPSFFHRIELDFGGELPLWDDRAASRLPASGSELVPRFAELPYDYQAGSPIRVRALNGYGGVLAEGDWIPEVLPPATTPILSLEYVDASTKVSPGGSYCVCGRFPSALDVYDFRLGDTLLGEPSSASPFSATFDVPIDMPFGEHSLSISPNGPGATVVDPDEPLEANVIGVDGSIDSDKLRRLQSTPVTFSIKGIDRPFPMAIVNHTPSIISLSGGDTQMGLTSGGDPNVIKQTVTGIAVGNFNISYTINLGDCPCKQPDNTVTASDRELDALLLDVRELGRFLPDDIADFIPRVGFSYDLPSEGRSVWTERFRVAAERWDSAEASRILQGSIETENGGVFYFSSPGNWDMLLKVIDGCSFNDRYWVFAAASTHVEIDLRVTDSESGMTREYSNPLGQAAPAITDTEAFATCP